MISHRDRGGGVARSGRVFHHVEMITDVRPMDVLSFLDRDSAWREGTVHSRACDVDVLAAWWVVVSDWQDNEVRQACRLVQRLAGGSLAEIVGHDHAPPVIFLP